MYIEELSSGSYRITQTYKKRRYRITIDHKPTTKEATLLIAEKLKQFHDDQDRARTFLGAFNEYMDSRSNVCSASTLRSYGAMIRTLPEWFTGMKTADIEQKHVQKLINEYSEDHSPKSVRNVHGLIAGVMKMARPDIILRTTLPAKKEVDIYIPTDEEVQAILKEMEGTEYEIPIFLAIFGLRRSEICALTLDDLNGNFISITKAKIQRSDMVWIIKDTPKTCASNREVYIPDFLRDLIIKRGHIYEGDPGNIRRALEKTEKRLGISKFSLHKLRHYFASTTHEMGITDASIMEMGGWSSDHVMKAVYRHSKRGSVSEGQKRYAQMIQKMAV